MNGFSINLKTQLHADAAALHWDAGKIGTVDGLLDPLIGSYQRLLECENADTAQVFGDRKAELQSLFTEIKANPGCTAGMARDMGLVTTSSKPAPADMQPTTHAVWWLFRRTRVYPHPNSRS